MPSQIESRRIVDLERQILGALCNPLAESPLPQQAPLKSNAGLAGRLLAHNWRDEEHRVVFDAILRLPGRSAAELREQLPAQATRMGFPDVEWADYFDSARPEVKSLDELITELLATAR